MKPAPFEYLRAKSIGETLAFLGAHDEAAILAGGQSLLAMMNMRAAAPSHLVDISGIEDLRKIKTESGDLVLGALVRHCDLETSSLVADGLPLLAEAASQLAHPAIRNRGTIGGSLALADPAAELPACILALEGTIEATGAAGTRRIAAEGFFTGAFATALTENEVLTAVRCPVPVKNTRFSYEKLARRHGDYALVGLAARAGLRNGRLEAPRFAFFAAADRPVLARSAAAVLDGEAPDAEIIERACTALREDLDPVGQPGCSAGTKMHLAGVLLRRAVARLIG
jgi:carbon-monoxide dehydrogenase medium subunit